MHFRYSLVAVCFTLLSGAAMATTHTITNSGLTFDPNSITINLGDTIDFNIGSAHNVVEVSQATWNANGNTSNGGFTLPFGGGTLVIQSAGTYYYVCSPHASLGMKGTITVEVPTITTGTLAASQYCKGATLSVPFSISGTFNSGNVFTAQLSNATGGFGSPVAIGTLTGTSGGQVSASIPANTPAGTGYRIRVVSSSPVVLGSDNGGNIAVLDAPSAAITPSGPTTFCAGGDVTLNANTGSGLSYMWTRNGSTIAGATGDSYVAATSGSYRVEVSNGSCSSISPPVLVTVNPADPTTLTWTGATNSDWSTVGNWDSPCATPSAGDTVVIGSGSTPPSAIPSISLARLVIGNASGVSLSGDVEITGELTLNAGSITLGGNTLTIAAGAVISGGGASSFIITNGSGTLTQAGIGSGGRSGNILFPVGSNATSYTPVVFTNSGTQDGFAVRVADGVLTGGANGTPITANVVGKTWFIEEGSSGGSNAGILFQWDTPDEHPGFDRGACYVAHHDGSAWSPLQAAGPAAGSGPYQKPVTGVTTFSPFAIGDNASPLPVELRTFTARVVRDAAVLRWETAREDQNLGFEVQRSVPDDDRWESVGFVPGHARGSGAHYEFTDRPGHGSWLYRLRQVDVDGGDTYSRVLEVAVYTPADSPVIRSVYPNPVRASAADAVRVEYATGEDGQVTLTLFDIRGRRAARLIDAGDGSQPEGVVRFSAAGLPPGSYLLQLRQGTSVSARQLVIVR